MRASPSSSAKTPKAMNVEDFIERDLESINDLPSLSAHLERLLESGVCVWVESDGSHVLLFERALVEKLHGLKVHIYADEHTPPHFHVKSANVDAAFAIQDCTLIKGSADRKLRDLIEYWHKLARPKLIRIWNETRPTDCPVGKIDASA